MSFLSELIYELWSGLKLDALYSWEMPCFIKYCIYGYIQHRHGKPFGWKREQTNYSVINHSELVAHSHGTFPHYFLIVPHFTERLTWACSVEQRIAGDIITNDALKTHEKWRFVQRCVRNVVLEYWTMWGKVIRALYCAYLSPRRCLWQCGPRSLPEPLPLWDQPHASHC